MSDKILVDKDWMIRVMRFMDLAAGEGLWFRDDELYTDELDAAMIFMGLPELYDEEGDSIVADWVPSYLKEKWSA